MGDATAERPAPHDVLANQTYAHLLARWMVRPLVGTPVRPNHLTVLRIAVGIAAAIFLAVDAERWALWSGACWAVACLLDRADGELARIADLRSESGRRLDFAADLVLDAVWFLGVGLGLRGGALGEAAPALGVVCCLAMIVVQGVNERYDRRAAAAKAASPPVAPRLRRFHPDDGLFLLAPLTWFGLLAPVLVASAIVLPIVACGSLVRLARQPRLVSGVPPIA